jgi:hypothetical protein
MDPYSGLVDLSGAAFPLRGILWTLVLFGA